MLSTQPNLEATELEHVEVVVVAAVVCWIAFDAAAVCSGRYGTEHVDHGTSWQSCSVF